MGNDELTYVYIMGRAHSGTTILDCLLDNVEGIQGCGELVVGLRRLSGQGKHDLPDGSRPFWNSVKKTYQSQGHDICWSEAVNNIYNQGHISNLLNVWLKDYEDKYVLSISKSIRFISESISDTSGSDCIVDSSKEITMATFLARFESNSKLIHLIRNPEHVLASTLYRIRHKHGFRFLRTNFESDLMEPVFVVVSSLGWLVGNLLCELIKYSYPEKTITVRYEDLLDDYDVLTEIGNHIGKDTESVVKRVEKGEKMSTGNKISGNKLLNQKEFKFDDNINSRHLPVYYKYLVNLITMPLRSKYGYN